MSEQATAVAETTSAVETQVVEPRKAAAKKVTPKKADSKGKATKPSKAPVKKTAPKAAAAKDNHKSNSSTEFGIEKSSDVPWCKKKVQVLSTMKKMGAIGSNNAKGTNDIAAKAGLKPRDVRHYCYHAIVSGLTGISHEEGSKSYSFYLTAKGAKTDFAAELKSVAK